MIYEQPKFRAQYQNFIGGEWVAPKSGQYFDKISPVTGEVFTQIPRSNGEDIDLNQFVGKDFPASTGIVVKGLAREEYLVEIEAIVEIEL